MGNSEEQQDCNQQGGGGGRGRKKMEREREDKSLATQYGFVYLNASSKVPGCS